MRSAMACTAGRLLVALLLLLPAGARVAAASEAEEAPAAEAGAGDALARERAARDRLESELAVLRQMVEELREARQADQAELEALRDSVQGIEAEQLRRYRGTGAPGGGERVGLDKQADREYQQAERQVLEQRRGVLLPAGQLLFEPGFQYTNFSRDRVELSGFSIFRAILIGRFDVVDLDRDVYQMFLNSRYGITDWLEAEFSVPYFFREDTEIFGARGVEEQINLDSNGFGDISGGLFAQVLYEKRWIPDTVLSVRFSAPTGTDFSEIEVTSDGRPTELPLGSGFWGIQAGVTFSKTTDPAVVFSSFRYTWNLEDTKNGIDFDPGDTFEFSGGLAFALNERIAMSFTYQHRYTDEFLQGGAPLLRSDANSGTMFLGMSYTLNRWTAVSFNVGIGVTKDAPDLTFEIRLPLRMPFRTPVLKVPRLPWQSATREEDGREVLLE